MNEENKKKLEHWKLTIPMMEECELFLIIDGVGGLAQTESHAFAHGHFDASQEVIQDGQEFYLSLQKLVLKELTRRCRVHPMPPENVVQLCLWGPPEHPKWNYYQWYRFWKDWMNSFPADLWEIVAYQIHKEKPALVLHLPIKNWDEVKKFSVEECLHPDALDTSQEEIEDYYGGHQS